MTEPADIYLISPDATIRETLACINRAGALALVVDAEKRLIGTVTDGDVRRAVLGGADLGSSVRALLELRDAGSDPKPITAPIGAGAADLLKLMTDRGVREIPLLDEDGRVSEVARLQDLIKEVVIPLKAVVMAGGFGKRLMPLTEDTPKPMLPVGNKPILELIVNQLQHSGIRKVHVTTHYKPEVIRDHFGDGLNFGLEIDYVNEDEPLGTAGALSGVAESNEPMLVLNGDILTNVDFRAMLAFHREHNAELTVAVRQYDVQVPYGVVQCDGARVIGLDEKPTLKFFVNAGVYLLEPAAHRSVPAGRRFDMTDLIGMLTHAGRPVVAFPIVEYWMDIGREADYTQAQEDIKNMRPISR